MRREILKEVKKELIDDYGMSSLLFDYIDEMISLEVSHFVSDGMSELQGRLEELEESHD